MFVWSFLDCGIGQDNPWVPFWFLDSVFSNKMALITKMRPSGRYDTNAYIGTTAFSYRDSPNSKCDKNVFDSLVMANDWGKRLAYT